jgi:hypothetical protein
MLLRFMKFNNISARTFTPQSLRWEALTLMPLRRCRVRLLEFTPALSSTLGRLIPLVRAAHLTWAQEGAHQARLLVVVEVELPTRAAEG